MTPKYWLRIVCGMLAIFAVGMLVNMGINHGRAKVTEIVDGSGALSFPLMGMGFHLDGQNLGGFERIELLRSQPRQVDSAILRLKLNDTAFVSLLTNCRLTINDPQNISEKTTFFCADSAVSAQLDLVQFGHIEIVPTGEQVAIWLPADVATEIRTSSLDEDVTDSANVDIDAGEKGLNVKINGQPLVNVIADSGRVVIRDSSGKEVIRVTTDGKP